MPAAIRSYATTGLALVGAGVITAAQVAAPLSEAQTRVVRAAVNLAAAVGSGQACSGYNVDGCDIWAPTTYTPVALDPSGSPMNIPANLLNAVISIPRAFVDAVNELSYALEVTGSWWVYTPTNVLGTDPADPPKEAALVNLAIPFKPLSNALAEHIIWGTRANLPMDASCTGSVGPTCSDATPILGKMFQAPPWTLFSGYQFPTVIDPVSDAEGAIGEPIDGSVGNQVGWSGAYVKLDPIDPINAVTNYLQADPSTNTPETVTMTEISATLNRLGKALEQDFNPIVPMSFLLKGWPYTALTPLFLPLVPALCPTCNPENPGGPAITQSPAAAETTVLAAAASAEPSVPEAATPAADTSPVAPEVEATPAGEPVKAAARSVPTPAAALESSGPAGEDTANAAAGEPTASAPAGKHRRGSHNGARASQRAEAAKAAADTSATSGTPAGE